MTTETTPSTTTDALASVPTPHEATALPTGCEVANGLAINVHAFTHCSTPDAIAAEIQRTYTFLNGLATIFGVPHGRSKPRRVKPAGTAIVLTKP